MVIEKIDKKIILRLLKNGRASVRDISRYTGVSPQLVSYKIRSCISRGIIRSFSIRTSPNLYGYYHAFVAIDSKVVDAIRVSLWVSCLERIEVVEIYSNTMEGLMRDIDRISSMSKGYYMSYIPPQRLYRRSPIVERFIRAIRSEPRSSFSRIAEISGLDRRTAVKIYRWLRRNNLVSVIPVIDIDEAGIKIVIVFTRRAERLLLPAGIDYEVLLYIRDDPYAFFISAFPDSYEAKRFISDIVSQDRDADIMVIYDYGFEEIE
jgi:DNA-binding Lrp family transcriptional regulator